MREFIRAFALGVTAGTIAALLAPNPRSRLRGQVAAGEDVASECRLAAEALPGEVIPPSLHDA